MQYYDKPGLLAWHAGRMPYQLCVERLCFSEARHYTDIKNLSKSIFMNAAVPRLPPLRPLLLLRALFKPIGHGPSTMRTEYLVDRIDRASVRRYNRLLGFRGDELPLTWYYLLTQRAHLATMLAHDFPLRIAGLIHASNALEEHARYDPSVPMTVKTELHIESPDERGAVYCRLVTSGEQLGQPVFICNSTYLARKGIGKGKSAPAEPPAALRHLLGWRLDSASGRGYARVSGDWNPIHLWRWSARLFGMREPIIHGMHTVGKVCAALQAAHDRRVVSLSARFKAPVPLGSSLVLAADDASGTYIVSCDGRTVVEGRYALA
jgi:acyl dehydratase